MTEYLPLEHRCLCEGGSCGKTRQHYCQDTCGCGVAPMSALDCMQESTDPVVHCPVLSYLNNYVHKLFAGYITRI